MSNQYTETVATNQTTPQIAGQWLYHYNLPGGHRPGGFIQTLMEAITKADQNNLERLNRGFPGYVAAYRLIWSDPQGIHTLTDIATGTTKEHEND